MKFLPTCNHTEFSQELNDLLDHACAALPAGYHGRPCCGAVSR